MSAIVSGGLPTVAVISRRVDGVKKPGGVPSDNAAVPPLSGWNAVVPIPVDGAIVTGLIVIVPTVVGSLVTVTSAVTPVASGWQRLQKGSAGYSSVPSSSHTARISSGVS